MTNKDFLDINSIDKQVDHLLTLNSIEEKSLLDFLKNKRKSLYFQLTGKLKSAKSNPKSKKVLHEILLENEIHDIDINKINPNPYQPRLEFNESKINDMMNSITAHGLLQPISINKSANDTYELVIGSTRLEACKRLKFKTIKCIISSTLKKDDKEFISVMIEKALIENIHRNDLDNMETALSFKKALDEGIYKNQASLATAIGKQKIYVTKMLSILKLENEIINDLRINRSINDLQALYFIQRIGDSEIQIKKYFELVDKKCTRADIINFVKGLNNNNEKSLVTLNDIKVKNNKLVLKSDISSLDKEKKQNFQDDLDELIKKYFR